jgi:WD40 repeat protein
MAVLQAEGLLITGSADTTARVWDLHQGAQLYLLRHLEPVVAVQLPSAALAATATKSGAFLWRGGQVLRRFAVLPVGGGAAGAVIAAAAVCS